MEAPSSASPALIFFSHLFVYRKVYSVYSFNFAVCCVFAALAIFCQPVLSTLHTLIRYSLSFSTCHQGTFWISSCYILTRAIFDARHLCRRWAQRPAPKSLLAVCFDIRRDILSMSTSRSMYLVSTRANLQRWLSTRSLRLKQVAKSTRRPAMNGVARKPRLVTVMRMLTSTARF